MSTFNRALLVGTFVLSMAACHSGYSVTEPTGCKGWSEVPSVVVGERCLVFQTGISDQTFGGIQCYPKGTKFKACLDPPAKGAVPGDPTPGLIKPGKYRTGADGKPVRVK